jgi:hypothetical protein
MILAFEMVCIATGHAATNSALIQTISDGYPDQHVRVYAHHSHIHELRSDPVLVRHTNVSLQAVPISPHYMYRTHIVSLRRGLRELWTLFRGLSAVPAREPCLIVLLSATPTAIFAASLLTRLMPRRLDVQVVMHGNLNDAFGWRTRNPVARMVDLRAALDRRNGGRLRLLVLEDAISRALVRRAPGARNILDVLPHPISPIEVQGAEPNHLAPPIRIGLVGQATESKGITPFLAMARAFRQSHPSAVSFHIVGNAPRDIDLNAFAVLSEPVPTLHISRPEYLEKLRRLHYVCLLLRPDYYELSASGALMDAVIWMRPVIATRVPIIEDLFDRFGDIGELCDDVASAHAAVARLASAPDPQRYERQIANLRRLRTSRLPETQAPDYRRLIDAAFPALLTARQRESVNVPSHG